MREVSADCKGNNYFYVLSLQDSLWVERPSPFRGRSFWIQPFVMLTTSRTEGLKQGPVFMLEIAFSNNNMRLIHHLKTFSLEHGLSCLRFGQYVRVSHSLAHTSLSAEPTVGVMPACTSRPASWSVDPLWWRGSDHSGTLTDPTMAAISITMSLIWFVRFVLTTNSKISILTTPLVRLMVLL